MQIAPDKHKHSMKLLSLDSTNHDKLMDGSQTKCVFVSTYELS